MSTPVPLPGRRLPESGGGAAPEDVRARVDALLARLTDVPSDTTGVDELARRAQILERAHEVLVESLAAVDKV
ncbi:hypothetical protein [Prescottella subtropica]|uniref:hypothetical protein n=1 Tax=Prescottella subtropica TaxID=2545757 RepID=UPI0010F7C789|nr:hypothetical protein [Prescottella subtropica]